MFHRGKCEKDFNEQGPKGQNIMIQKAWGPYGRPTRPVARPKGQEEGQKALSKAPRGRRGAQGGQGGAQGAAEGPGQASKARGKP